MTNCGAIGCNSDSRKNKGISFHKFPRDPTMRLKWVRAMKREGFKPSDYSRVCSAHFNPEDFEEISGCGRKLRRVLLKRNAVPSIFSFSEITTLMRALERKAEPKPKRKKQVAIKIKVPPPCLGDGSQCCEREDYENLPIVSKMCNKCVMSCREEYNPEEPGQIDPLNTLKNSVISNQKNQQLVSRKLEEISQEAIMKYDAKAEHYQCKGCPYRSNQKINLWTHFKSVHLRDRPFMCDLCPFAASQKINLETHIKSVHLRSRPFKCWECPFAATQQGNLQTHIRIVHFEKGKFKDEGNKTKFNKEETVDDALEVKNELAYEPVDKTKEKLFGTYQNNEDDPKQITPAEATAAIKILGTFLMQSDINADDLLLHSQYNEIVMSKIRN